MKLWIIGTESISKKVLSAEEVKEVKADEYLDRASKLVMEKKATYQGRILEEETGQVYQVFELPKTSKTSEKAVFVADPNATNVVGSLVGKDGQWKRMRIGTTAKRKRTRR